MFSSDPSDKPSTFLFIRSLSVKLSVNKHGRGVYSNSSIAESMKIAGKGKVDLTWNFGYMKTESVTLTA